MSDDLWPNDIVDSTVIPPVVFLKEQASALTKKTNGLVEGHIESSQDGSSFIHRFNFVAPALGHYTVSFLRVIHEIDLYPITVEDTLRNTTYQAAQSKEEFEGVLLKAFSTEKVKKVIHSLIAQSRD